MFYFSVSSTAKLTGQATKRVECEKCRAVYGYTLERTASAKKSAPYMLGAGSLDDRAAEAAEKKLKKRLESAVDAVPCPVCGWVQDEMNVAEIDRRFGWVRKAPYYLFFVAVALALPCRLLVASAVRRALGPNAKLEEYDTSVNVLTCAFAAIGPIAYYVWMRRRAWRFNLNKRLPEAKRIAEGRRLAILVSAPDGQPDAQPWRPIRSIGEAVDESDWRKD